MGRPSKYKEEYCQTIIDYFGVAPYTHEGDKLKITDPKFLTGFAKSIEVTTFTILQWAKDHEEFSLALKESKELQRDMIATNAILGNYNSTFCIFTLKNIAGWRDSKDLEIKGELTFKDQLKGACDEAND